MTDKLSDEERHMSFTDRLARIAAEEGLPPTPPSRYPDLELSSYGLLLSLYELPEYLEDELAAFVQLDREEWTSLSKTVLECWPPGKEPLASSFRGAREEIGKLSEAGADLLRAAIARCKLTGDTTEPLSESMVWQRIVIAFFSPMVVPWLKAGAADADAGANEAPPPGDSIMVGWLVALNTLRDTDKNDMRKAAPLIELALKRNEKRGPLVESLADDDPAVYMHVLRLTAGRVFRAVGREHEATRQLQLCLDEEDASAQAGRPLQPFEDFGETKLRLARLATDVAYTEYSSARWRSALPRYLRAFDRAAAARVPADDRRSRPARLSACVCRGIADAAEAGRPVPGRKELHLMIRKLELSRRLANEMTNGNQRVSPQQALGALSKTTEEFERVFGAESITLLPSLWRSAECLQAVGDITAVLETARRLLHLAGTASVRSVLSPYDLGHKHGEIAIELQDKLRDYAAAEAELRIAVGYFRESLGNDHPSTAKLLRRLALCQAMRDGCAAAAATTKARFNPAVASAFEEALAAANACIGRPQNMTTLLRGDGASDSDPSEREKRGRQFLEVHHASADVLICLSLELLKSTEARHVDQAHGHLLQAKGAHLDFGAHPQQHLMKGSETFVRLGLEKADQLLAKVKRLKKAASKRRR